MIDPNQNDRQASRQEEEVKKGIDPVKKEQTKDKSTDETASFISLPSFSLPALVNLRSNLDAYCLFEILFEDDSDEVHVENETSFTGRFFQTMFQVIISPNAP